MCRSKQPFDALNKVELDVVKRFYAAVKVCFCVERPVLFDGLDV